MPNYTDPKLAEYRRTIDNLDMALIHLLAERFKVTKKVGFHKKEMGYPTADTGREQEQIARYRVIAKEADLDPEIAEKFLNFLITEVVRNHLKIKEGKIEA